MKDYLFFLVVLLLFLPACRLVYRPDIQSGNILEQSTIDQLKPGMARNQVSYLLGSCVLESPFQVSRKDYVYFFQPGCGVAKQRSITLFFLGDRLQRIENHDFG